MVKEKLLEKQCDYMSEKKIVIGGGLSFTTILFFIFLVLKLTNYINWSWLWITCPLWITPIVLIVLFLIVVIIFLLIFFFGKL